MPEQSWFDDLTWTCHVCHAERPDAHISVFKRTRMIGNVQVGENVRYCNDRKACVLGAPGISFFGEATDV